MTTEKAKTAAEFKAKYGRKRLSPSTAGKAVLYNLLYDKFQRHEKAKEIQSLYPSFNKFFAMVETYEQAQAYNMYLDLQGWLITASMDADNVRNSLVYTIAYFYSLTADAVAAENLRDELKETRKEIGDKAYNPHLSIWLRTLTIDNYTPQSDNSGVIGHIRENIDNSLRYIFCYNTLIDIIAEALDTPEIDLYKINMDATKMRIDILNEALSTLREDIALYRTAELKSADSIKAGEVLSDIVAYTPEYLAETMKGFAPVSFEPDPIPVENIDEAKEVLKQKILKEYRNQWYILPIKLMANYWRK